MATTVVMPKQGQSVESCIIVEWKKKVGDQLAVDDVLCEVETDKATLEVPAPVAGVLLAIYAQAGDEVPVLTRIAAIGEAGESVEGASIESAPSTSSVPAPAPTAAQAPEATPQTALPAVADATATGVGAPASPRARGVAAQKGIDATQLAGTGPGGRVIERDVLAAAAAQPRLTPVAKAMVAEGGFALPAQGSGPGGRVMSRDLVQTQGEGAVAAPALVPAAAVPVPAASAPVAAAPATVVADEVERIPVKGVRKIIAERMLQSLQTTAQLTLNRWADARVLQALRKRFKESPEALGLRGITINDLVLFAVAKSLRQHPDLNAHFVGDAILQYRPVHLGFAVDTARGLVVPVIHGADSLSLRGLAAESKRLSAAALDNKSAPDDLAGGTFTVTNLGGFGVESFTPLLNPPQVGILGVGGISLRPVEVAGEVQFQPQIGLSLTINHQVVDGAPGARFLQTVAQVLSELDNYVVG